jgi:hypothetical protein
MDAVASDVELIYYGNEHIDTNFTKFQIWFLKHEAGSETEGII